ncbi:MAG: type II toxin-antitoxin system PemK/MazF family toxin [Alphaproteobacteria bacterium]
MVRSVRRFDIFLIGLDPTIGSEMRKTRPCLIVSPDEMNRHLRTVIVAPLTSAQRSYPTRVPLSFQDKHGQIALDQIRVVDKERLIKRLGAASEDTRRAVVRVLTELFADSEA